MTALLASGLGICSLGLAACGGSSNGSNQSTASGLYPVDLPVQSFPTVQHVGKATALRLAVRNTGAKAIPDVTVTLTTGNAGTAAPPFAEIDPQKGLAQHWRQVWLLDLGPVNGETVTSNSWSLGNLDPGQTANFTWHVHPLITGRHVINWRIAPAMLGGDAVFASGVAAQGSLQTVISGKAPSATVRKNGTVAKSYAKPTSTITSTTSAASP